MHKLYRGAMCATFLSPFLAMSPTVALAQSTQNISSNAKAEETYSLPDVIVTAQRREEKLQDVPIAVTALGKDQMEKIGLASSTDLINVIPGLASNPSSIRGALYLRGVGNNSSNSAPSVLTYIDGVYQAFSPPVYDFTDIEQISVAKGPQGTLFGRNATGGVIQITTVNPLNWQGLDAQVGYANYNTISANLTGAVKFSEHLAASVSGYYNNQQDGWGVNRFDGSDVFTAKRYGVRTKIVAESDDVTATLVGNYFYNGGAVGAAAIAALGSRYVNLATGQFFSVPDRFDVLLNSRPYGENKIGGASLTLEKHVGDIKFMSISSYQQAKEANQIDQDGSALPVTLVNVFVRRSSFTQEFQASGSGSSYNWVAGLFYYHLWEKPDLSFGGTFPTTTFFTPPGVPYVVRARRATDAYAAYAQGTFEVLPKTNLTLGVRYTVEETSIGGFTTGSTRISPISAGIASATFRKPTFRVSLDRKFTPELLAYMSYNRGFNAGFFNAANTRGFGALGNPTALEPETIDAYEIGIKSDWLDQRLRVNAAAFLYNYSNLQQQIISFGVVNTINAASARISGVDLDIVAQLTQDLTLSVSGNYLDTRYKSYPLAPIYIRRTNNQLAASGPDDAVGNDLVQAPRYSVQATLSHRLRTGIGSFDSTASLNYRAHIYNEPQNQFPIAARTLVDLSERWTSNDERTTVTAWVKNLTNKEYDVSLTVVAPAGLTAIPGAPRTFGVTFGQRF